MKQLNAIKEEKNRMGMRFGMALKTLMLFAVFIGGMGTAWAQTVNWNSATQGATSYPTGTNTTATINVKRNVSLTGQITIDHGTVTINADGGNWTITRGARNFAMFDVKSGATLVINGGDYKITIDGNAGNYPGDSDSSVSGTTGQEDSWGHSAVQVRVGGTARLTDVTIKSNYLKDITSVERNPKATHGGAIFVRGTLECTNCTIYDCRSTQGGGVCVFSGGNATITGGSIHDCQSYSRGGGACVINTTNNGGSGNYTPNGSSATMILSGVEIYNNTSPNGFGGGGYSEFIGADLIVKDNTIIRNNHSKSGGFGVTVADMGDIELRDCDIYSNSSTANSDYGGGGLYIGGTVTAGATAYVYEGCKIHDNVARRGGGIYMASNMHLVIEGGEIYDNSTNGTSNDVGGYGSGGGVYMGAATRGSRASSFEMNGGKIYNNTATGREGGGVYIGSGIVTITGGEMYNNNAGADGGGIYLYSGSVNMLGGEVYSNNANGSANNGGGFYLGGGDFTMSGSAKMYSNTAYDGAGLYLNNGTFQMQGGEVYGNVAANYGGGAYLTANCTFQMTGGSLGKTGAAKNSAKRGGGLYDLGTFSMSNGNIVNNEATTDLGGGAYIQTTVATPLSGGTVAGNTAATNGGGLYITGTSTATTAVTVSGTSFYGNTAPYGDGGGLYLESSATFTMNGGNIGVDGQAKNSAKRGGGVFDKGSFTMNSGNITNNEATNTHGGGAFVMTNQATTLKAGNVSNNTAKQHGGGVYITGATSTGGSAVTVSGVSIFGNTAAYNADGSVNGTGNGGGIYLDGSALNSFTMTGGAIGTEGNPNKARQGGGAYIAAPFSMTGGSISYNQALISIGGGAYINSTSATTISDATIKENTAATNGGGIYLANGSVTVTDATFEHNTANWQSGQGGGIYAAGSMTINGTSSFIKNEANLGGAATVNNGSFTMEGGIVGGSEANANKARRRGGGFYVTGTSSTVTLQGGEVSYNEALTATDGAGGGIYVNSSPSDVSQFTGAVKLNYNKALLGGGAYINTGNITINGTGVQVNNNQATGDGTEIMNGNTPSGIFTGDGGGMYVVNGSVTIKGTGVINNNYAGHDGGAIFTKNIGSSITIGESGSNNAFTLRENHADNWGGAIRVGGTITLYTGTISNNYAGNAGGGVYVTGGDFNMHGGQVCTNLADNGMGGGIFMSSGLCTLSEGAVIGGTDASYGNAAQFGGGVYSEGGTITVKGGMIDYNAATKAGGGIYSTGTTETAGKVYMQKEGTDLSYLEYNTAPEGGGIYAENGEVFFSDGYIQYNHATTNGGGIYVNTDGSLYLSGSANLHKNYTPSTGKGGGVYLKGTVVVGETSKALGTITAEDNFCADTDNPINYVPTDDTRNNVYLPNPVATPDEEDLHIGVITVIEDGIDISSKVGFSVPRNHVPVIYCKRSADNSSWTYLDRFQTGPSHDLQTVLFDDTQRYISVHYTDSPYFDPDHVYLYGFWPEAVKEEPTDFSLDNIDSPEDLAWLITVVNGRKDMVGGQEDLDPRDLEDEVVNLTADIDMSAFGWVPIGAFNSDDTDENHPFKGTFNGNGHTITGVGSMEYKQHMGYGLFGNVEGGTVENVFLKDAEFLLGNGADLVIGALVAELNEDATLANSEASGTILVQNASAIVGGAVGRIGHTNASTAHSLCAMVEMKGGRMGGLVGELESGNLYNSFANPKFTYLGGNKYFSALVGTNKGTVENCYARLQGSVPTNDNAADYFGWLAGQNTGYVNYCYSKANANYFADNSNGSADGYGYYADNTQTPYLYTHRDNQVVLALDNNPYVPTSRSGDKQMLYFLNNWVNDKSDATTTYTSWGRPTTKVINDDLPVLRMPSTDAVACTGNGSDGEEEVFLNYRQINSLLAGDGAFTDAAQSIWLYSSNGSVLSNEGSDAKLYIAEDVDVIPLDREEGVINAYVGITIANVAGENGANPTFGDPDAIDWHMFSTPLKQAPLGIDYRKDGEEALDNTSYPFSYGHPDNMPYYLFHQESSEDHGYFPSHRYGSDYPTTNTTLANQSGNYYYEWDFYTYYEPEYHWINFKRNSNSHWHEDAHDVQIHYYPTADDMQSHSEGNENYLVPGRGYLVAFADSATYLQCHGMLNTGSEISLGATTLGSFSTGYNLLGNPYQACLDFDAFAQYNSGDAETKLWGSINDASYIILDETSKKYVAYAYGSSENPFGAGRYLHPHQGFMMVNEHASAATATFVDNDAVHMRVVNDEVQYRGASRPTYPLVNLFATEANGNESMVTVELGRPDKGGAKLMSDLHLSKGQLWCHYNDADYALAFTQSGITELPIRFKTLEDNEYTMTWSTHNGDFSYLHLIDNITGVDVDCLSQSSYKFSSKTSDFESRFRLVFGYTGIEEPEVPAESQTSFAFMMGDELVVNGEGTLQLFDVSGRLLATEELQGPQSTMSLPKVSTGVYVLRLNTADGTKIQKIVVGQ